MVVATAHVSRTGRNTISAHSANIQSRKSFGTSANRSVRGQCEIDMSGTILPARQYLHRVGKTPTFVNLQVLQRRHSVFVCSNVGINGNSPFARYHTKVAAGESVDPFVDNVRVSRGAAPVAGARMFAGAFAIGLAAL